MVSRMFLIKIAKLDSILIFLEPKINLLGVSNQGNMIDILQEQEEKEISITDSWLNQIEEQMEEKEEIRIKMLFIQKWFRVRIV